jgi:hypothetical protein
VGPRAGLDDMEKGQFLTLPDLELRPLGRPASIQSLYRLRYRRTFFEYKAPSNERLTKCVECTSCIGNNARYIYVYTNMPCSFGYNIISPSAVME